MSVHWNANKVIGGIQNPRFLIVGPELSPNVSFEEGLTGVSSPTSAATQLFDATTPFLDYVLKVEDDSATLFERADITVDAGETVANKRFIVFGYARNHNSGQHAFRTMFKDTSNGKDLVANEEWRRIIVHEHIFDGDTNGNSFTYQIFPAWDLTTNTGAVRVDEFRVRKVLAEYELPLPERGSQTQVFRIVKQAEHELINKAIKTYKAGFRYYYEASYDRLTPGQELIRAQLAMTDNEILFFPHKDSWDCYLVKWADDLERKWAFGTAAHGHAGDVQLISQEILHIIPTEIFDALQQYEYPEEEFIVESSQESIIIHI